MSLDESKQAWLNTFQTLRDGEYLNFAKKLAHFHIITNNIEDKLLHDVIASQYHAMEKLDEISLNFLAALHSIAIDRYLRCLGHGQKNSADRYRHLLTSLHNFLPQIAFLDFEDNIRTEMQHACPMGKNDLDQCVHTFIQTARQAYAHPSTAPSDYPLQNSYTSLTLDMFIHKS